MKINISLECKATVSQRLHYALAAGQFSSFSQRVTGHLVTCGLATESDPSAAIRPFSIEYITSLSEVNDDVAHNDNAINKRDYNTTKISSS